MSGPEKADYTNDRGEILNTIDVQARSPLQVYTFETDELTALCPFEFGGPDHYDLIIRYIPIKFGVESKSLKKYVEAWRDAEISAEDLADEIHTDVMATCDPEFLYVRLEQARRGGIEETVEVGDGTLRRDD